MSTYFPKSVNSESTTVHHLLHKMTQCLTINNVHSCQVMQSMAEDAILLGIMTDNSCILNPCHIAG